MTWQNNAAWNQIISNLNKTEMRMKMSSASKFILTWDQGLVKEEPSFPTLQEEHEQLQKPQYPELEESKR